MKYSWLALGCAGLMLGCVQLQGSPAMRPHVRTATDREVLSSPTTDTEEPVPDTVAYPGSADSAVGPGDGDGTPGDGATSASDAPAAGGGWTPPEAGSWERSEVTGAGMAPGGMLYPLPEFSTESVIGRFGDPRDGGRRHHDGIDILADRGTPVFTPAGGQVIASGSRSRSGNIVIVLSDDGEHEYLFMHLHERHVKRGDFVGPGQQIGTVGNTGNARGTAPHLHFEVRGSEGPIDPYPLLIGRR